MPLSFPRLITMGSIALFAVIATVALVKKVANRSRAPSTMSSMSIDHSSQKGVSSDLNAESLSLSPILCVNKEGEKKDDFPHVDRIYQLFTTGQTKLPIVETITYSSSVPWLKGRPAWVADYAAYYGTSRHFIARSLNGKADYFSQKVVTGSRFNVFAKDKKIQFYLLVDLSRCKMGFYYVDLETNERVHLKTYPIGVGKLDPKRTSGCLTPTGTYSLGNKTAIYKPGMMGVFQDKQVEMISVFGTRWIPFEKELESCSAPARGYGLKGLPWKKDSKTGEIIEDQQGLGKYATDGCICLMQKDMEEVFSIVITKPTIVKIVDDFHNTQLPGVEVARSTRK